jgi:hypothetical protein
MDGSRGDRVPPRLERAAVRFAQWRRTRQVGARIPEPLWQLASQLAASHGVSRTAALLGLDYYALQRRTKSQSSLAAPPRHAVDTPAFIELSGSTLAPAGEYVLEFENAAGSKLRVHCKGGAIPDLVALGRSLWNGGA